MVDEFICGMRIAAELSVAALALLVPEAHRVLERGTRSAELLLPVSIGAVLLCAATRGEGLAKLGLTEVRRWLELCARVSKETPISILTSTSAEEATNFCLPKL